MANKAQACKQRLLQRLEAANPGWAAYRELIDLANSLDFEIVESEYLGNYIVSGSRLVFKESEPSFEWPAWLPAYVASLHGLNADTWEAAGGYASDFYNEQPEPGAVFTRTGNDEDLGFPRIAIPEGLFCFQSNSSGAPFYVNTNLEVLYPNSNRERFEILDSLEEFTRTNIRCLLECRDWFHDYVDKIEGTILD